MENKNAIGEMINQAKSLEKNNISNMEYTNSLSMLVNSNDLAQVKDKELAEKIQKLNKNIEDVNTLTSELLNSLVSKFN